MADTPRLTDVAQRAGVSENTVSRVIRNKGSIADATRQRVNEAIADLGYVPNRAALSLASSRAPLIAVLLPSLSNIVFPEVLRGISAALAGSGLEPMVGVTDYDLQVEERLLSSLLAWRPSALITTGLHHTDAARRMMENCGIRVAELMEIEGDPVDLAVGLSHREAGRASARHLIQRGYRRIAYVGHDWDADRRARIRYEGFREALAEAGQSIAVETRLDQPSSVLSGREALARLLADCEEVDAVVFANDDMAVGGYMHCLSAGLRIPEDLALFGFNGLDIGQALPQPLSTIRSNRFLIGEIATQKLLGTRERPPLPEAIDTGFDIIPGATA
jgi:LacI family gluconate utilization system Gnt-I transcriptional repressor